MFVIRCTIGKRYSPVAGLCPRNIQTANPVISIESLDYRRITEQDIRTFERLMTYYCAGAGITERVRKGRQLSMLRRFNIANQFG